MADDWKNAPVVNSWETAEIVKPMTKSETVQLKNIPMGQYNDPRGAVASIGSGIVGNIAGGIAGIGGLVAGAVPGGESPSEKANRYLEATKEAIYVPPPNQASEQALEKVGDVGSTVSKAAGVLPASFASFSPEDDLQAAREFNEESRVAGEEKFTRILDEGVMKSAGNATLDATGSPLLATIVETAPLAIASILGAKGAVTKGAKKSPDKAMEKVPTIEELKAESKALYKAVDDAGIKISDESFAQAVDRITKDAMSKGARESLTPKTWAALNELKRDAKAGNLTLQKAEELRRVIKKAQNAADPADLASASRALSQWDNYVNSLSRKDLSDAAGPETIEYLKAARQLWSRSRKAEVIDDLIDTAQLNAGYFTGSGYENALRSQFRSLARNKKKMRMFTPDEQAAIRKVATGGPMENMLRYIGKLAPTGVVSAGIGAGAGFAAGGPLGAMAVPAAGGIARKLATRSTIKNAEKASETMRKKPTT